MKKLSKPSMTVVDLLAKDGEGYRHAFETLLETIPADYADDKLVANYANLNNSLDKYLSFTLLVKEGRIVAFSGLQKAPFPSGVARALSRTFYTHEIRANSLSGQTLPGPATSWMLPRQIAAGLEAGIEHLFVSMQGDDRRRTIFKRVFDRLNEQSSLPWPWIILEGRHNVCRTVNGELNLAAGCWQHVAYLDRGARLKFPLIREE